MQETRVQSLVQEDPTCRAATKPVYHSYWARAPQQEKPPQWEACGLQLESSPHSLQLEKAYMQQRRPSTATNK